MTNRQKELVLEAYYLERDIKLLNEEINKKQARYIEVANKLFDSIEDKGKVKVLLNGEKVSNY